MRVRRKTYSRVLAIKVVRVLTSESGVATEQCCSVVGASGAHREGSLVGWRAAVTVAGSAGWCAALRLGVDSREGEEGAEGEVKSVHCCEDG